LVGWRKFRRIGKWEQVTWIIPVRIPCGPDRLIDVMR
jgi:hypothetical protein